jgi:hypothetical protein
LFFDILVLFVLFDIILVFIFVIILVFIFVIILVFIFVIILVFIGVFICICSGLLGMPALAVYYRKDLRYCGHCRGRVNTRESTLASVGIQERGPTISDCVEESAVTVCELDRPAPGLQGGSSRAVEVIYCLRPRKQVQVALRDHVEADIIARAHAHAMRVDPLAWRRLHRPSLLLGLGNA